MPVDLMMPSIEVGIITIHIDKMLPFYRDTLGLTYESEMAFPGGMMHRMKCGDNIIKLVIMDTAPESTSPLGGPSQATGYRYFSIGVNNIQQVVSDCEAAGYPVATPVTPVFEGFGFTFLEDPDGNWIELFGPLPT